MAQIKHLGVQGNRKALLAQLSSLESAYLSIGKAIKEKAFDPENDSFYDNLLTCEMLLCVSMLMLRKELK